jgi:hypothetical protein
MKKLGKQTLSLMLGVAVFMGSSIGSNNAFAQPSEWQWTPTNASGVVLGQATINGTPADAADWIGAFDAAGNCAGASPVIINEGLAYFNLAVYGDDATTTDLDEGITAGEPFTLRVWQALTGGEATYPNDEAPEYLEGWANTNGAPIAVFSDPSVVYDFALDVIPYIICPADACIDGFVQTLEWAPAGGIISGPGVNGVYWDPAEAGIGVHEITYTIGEETVSCTVEVLATPDATIFCSSSMCANDGPMPLTAATEGGTWYGEGVVGSFFDPGLVNPPGDFTVSYAVSNVGCSDSLSVNIAVFSSPPTPEIFNDFASNTLLANNTGSGSNTLQWFTADGLPVEGASGLLFANPVVGQTYYLQVTNAYGCVAQSDLLTFVVTGVSEQSRDGWRVWWNPVTASIASNLPFDRLEWFDASGRQIAERAAMQQKIGIVRVWQGENWELLRISLGQ